MFATTFRHPQSAGLNALALTYALGGYALGIVLLTAPQWWLNMIGVLLTGHTLVYCAYFVHEFAHQSIFRTAEANNRWGTLMTWITGSCYVTFASLRRKHMRHHIDRADVVSFDYKAFLQRSPRWVTQLVLAMEWAYIPAVELIMHAHTLALPFKAGRNEGRARLVLVLLARVTLFGTLAWYSLKAYLLYLVSYMIMIHVLRFVDAFQHTYDVFVMEGSDIPNDKVRDHEYEQRNTYTNVVSLDRPWLNVLLLNFTFHNAHHERPIAPWYELPKLHEQLFAGQSAQVLPMRDLLLGHHRHRLARILSDDYGVVGTGKGKADRFLGALGASFLTAV